MKVPFSPPDISELEIEEVCRTLRSGWITTGPRTKQLEKNLADYLQTGYSASGFPRCVCLNSQTACAEMALRLLGIGAGDEVIVPAYTYTASASVICHVGARPVFIDCQDNCLEMDYDKVEAAITPSTKAVIAVDLAGIPCDYTRLYALAESKRSIFRPATELQKALGRIAILADTAHALGASRQTKMAGTMADFSSFSFHAVKNLTTAEGGALTWNHLPEEADISLYRQIQLYSLHGQSKDALAKTTLGAWEYDIVGPWYKCNMTDISAALGLKQLERYPSLLARRKSIIEKYDAAFRPSGIDTLPHFTSEYSSSGHLYLTRLPGVSLEQRSEVITRMAEQGVACNVHYKPLPMMTAYKSMGYDIKDFPNAYKFFENEVTLPLHTCLDDEQIEYIISTYSAIAQDYL